MLSGKLISQALLLIKKAADLPSVSDFDTTKITTIAVNFLTKDLGYFYD